MIKQHKIKIISIMLLLIIFIGFTSAWKNQKQVMPSYQAMNIPIAMEKIPKKEPTLLSMLKTAVKPIGTTMYVYGGGWNEADNGSGKETTSIGVSPAWEKFYKKQTTNYDVSQSSYQIHEGLDCSGYIGWILYNTFHDKDGEVGYVMKAEDMARAFSQKGWGTYISKNEVKDYQPRDIMSSDCEDCAHVYMVVTSCEDGSVLLLHSYPQGVQLNGTIDKYGNQQSEAVKLAQKYMNQYRSEWTQKYPLEIMDRKFLTHYAQMRWGINDKGIIKDPDHLKEKSAEEILQLIFS